MTTTPIDQLTELSADEVVTHSYVKHVPLPSGGTLALVTLDNGKDYKRPSTLGPRTMRELSDVLDTLRAAASAGSIQAVAITGKEYCFAAGADLSQAAALPSREVAHELGALGHATLRKLSDLGVPSFAFVNGIALGGGLEIALHCTYRVFSSAAQGIGLPEVFLGIIPGWGGATLLPRLIGPEKALRVIVENPLKNNRLMDGKAAVELGIGDALIPSVTFLPSAVAWADGVVSGRTKVKRANEPGMLEKAAWGTVVKVARQQVASKIGTVPKSPFRALDLVAAAKSGSLDDRFADEDDALADLLAGDQFAASMYAFDLVQKRAKKPVGAPEGVEAKKITKVGVLGAGLMASQFALLFARRLGVPVVITDVDQARVDAGVARIAGEVEKLREKGRISPDDANRITALVSGSVSYDAFADADWVIEAVFEEMSVKQDVFRKIEQVIAPDAILATNTSSLSVDEMASVLEHPERLVGFHFFNPVAVMPLLEVVRADETSDEALVTALAVAKTLKKTAIITADQPGFVVNRVLARVLGEAMRGVEEGTPFETVAEGAAPLGLPMSPFELLELVGLPVGAHVLDSHHAAWPERFYPGDGLKRIAEHGTILTRDKKGTVTGYDPAAVKLVAPSKKDAKPIDAATMQQRFEDALADEVHRMLEDHVVEHVEEIDLGLILGAGYPFQAGGISPYLDRSGASERVFGSTFHTPAIVGPASR
ncbi:3-hydroxyacyl-CoA dehydrogenase NAD-binding domain-containing protein [Curtobacterium sp. ODYSSEY 48 V2]|uniref:3-hydroxyacyl-CoA dehydrogenase NAD-binding domain-containing protein n=1 Tax=unclassified Curtobacterium TaxID=257496 RepID=UPI00204033AA|nr:MULTISPECIES: 3-hydroxyacyl-CoA dehydrogenase NAD-binding domain-containing protein [unclassified Curtobacterium]MCM3505163.1 3-hydroxyacyl-CoA dehydrogenase NAD-binding domain-containing protein [Curtobacterium sp. ODYSSEY 48 V2]MDB6427511.1 3-hydroxyacyl-CoA dehydrogenase NAD-binding domain-containing protein [Curtobacterium sp. 20TX0008]MDT0209296.1 3-hydroxyacyl-CoA dehydrogenase NAD-binding domain-containing protein [Curtobacterium sp. BRD11]